MSERLGYSPAEFAALFGKEQTWAYRKIYAKQIKVIEDFGNMLIPVSEIDRIIGSADYLDEESVSQEGSKRGRGRPKKIVCEEEG